MILRATLPNECTRLAHRRETFALVADRADTEAVWRRLVAERDARRAEAAVVIVLRWPGAGGGDDVDARVHFLTAADAGAPTPLAVVLGRHSSVDSPALPGASLRHAVVLAWPAARGEVPRVEVLDLRTDVGLGVPGGAAAHLESMGPLRFGVGAAEVVVVPVAAGAPLAPAGVGALWTAVEHSLPGVRRWRRDASPGDALADVLAWHAQLALAGALGARRTGPDGEPARPIGARRLEVAAARGQALDADDARRDRAWRTHVSEVSRVVCTAPRAQRMLEAAPPGARPLIVTTTWADLEDGVLLGRYDRCVASGDVQDESVSRVHALVVARRRRLFVIDTGSLNGTNVARLGAPDVALDDGRRATVLDIDDELYLHERRVVLRLDPAATPDA